MCTQRNPCNRELYQRHGRTMERYLEVHAVPALQRQASLVAARPTSHYGSNIGQRVFLAELRRRWTDHQIMNKWLQRFFCYLDRYHVKDYDLPTLSEVGFRVFRNIVYEPFKADMVAAVNSVIAADNGVRTVSRAGDVSDTDLVRAVAELHESADSSDDESPIVAAKRGRHAKVRDEWLSTTRSTPEYLIKAERALEAERLQLSDFRISSAAKAKIVGAIEEELLREAQKSLIEDESSGFRALLKVERWGDLQRMVRLYSRLKGGMKPVGDIFQQILVEFGESITARRQARLQTTKNQFQQSCDTAFMNELLELHTKFIATVRSSLCNHPAFHLALRNAFVDVLNNVPGRYSSAEILSSYCDRVLRVRRGREPGEEVEEVLEQITELFSYLTDKDMFAEFYRDRLAERLLNKRSASIDAEKLMITKLKVQCGVQFTSKMEGMLTDLNVGERQRLELELSLLRMGSEGRDFRVHLLSPGFWPSYTSGTVAVTKEMSRCISVFSEWHRNMHSNRNLKWIWTQGTASVQGTFGEKIYDFHVSTLQAIVLDAFSNGSTFTFDELSKTLNLDKSLLHPIVHSLSLGRAKLISKSPPGRKICGTDSFTANAYFTSSVRRIRIPVPSTASRTNVGAVEENRLHVVDASIVRIMKSRKTLKHNELLAEMFHQNLQFQPNARTVKQRIEALIDRGYLERNAADSRLYTYVA